MTIDRVLAQATVTDLDRAAAWYAMLFGRAPDDEPMTGLLEWHVGTTGGVQLWSEPERAGRSTIVVNDTDLDALASRLRDGGVQHGGIEQVTSSRALQLADPDGNRVVITGR